jgi:serine/threonine-protein kinase
MPAPMPTARPTSRWSTCRASPLVAWCNARELETPARIRLFIQVLDAVSYAHRRQVLHRDLKPSNILVTEQGEVRLLDLAWRDCCKGMQTVSQ